MANWVLFQWGPIQFQVFPLNVDSFVHHTGADWAKKEIAGAAMYREWVGEGDEQITLKGKIFPHFFARAARKRDMNHINTLGMENIAEGATILSNLTQNRANSGGIVHLDVLDNMRRLGEAHILIRGDGWHFGWFIIEALNRGHSFINWDGIGQQVDFEAQFQRVPIPNDAASNFQQLYSSSPTTVGA